MPWRGPAEPGEFPTLGFDVGEWIQEHCVVPDGYRKGEPFLLTDEMWRFVLNYYRLYPHAKVWPAADALQYFGGQLRRSQKWGKDPFGAALILAEALGPSRFDGWNSAGEPVGAPYPSPLIVCLGTSLDQVDNTWLRLLAMIRLGPLMDVPGLEAGQTRVVLPNGGLAEPATTSAKARLGAPMTFVTITEPHQFTLNGGYRTVAGAVKRNVAGMDGRWLELTNSWDPTEASEAQITGESNDPRIYVDAIEPHRVEDLQDDEALYAELLRQYGDSAREKGGWVNIRGRIMDEARSSRYPESDRRRYFLSEIVVGESTFADPVRWDAFRVDGDPLVAGEAIALGFDGSKYRDGTALIACRMRDGKLFELRVWLRPDDAPADWRVPSAEVDQFVKDTFTAYDVIIMFADPYRWQDYLDVWAGRYPDRIVEFPTNVETRMDKAIERFTTTFGSADGMPHDGSTNLTDHVKNTVVVKGSRKKPRPGDDPTIVTYYLKLAKKRAGVLIDAAIAAVLARTARAHALEHGLWDPNKPVSSAGSAPAVTPGADDASVLWRPSERLNL